MLRITGGKVYDPADGINGEVQDVCICDGRIVSAVEGGRTLDAQGCVVFPGSGVRKSLAHWAAPVFGVNS